jgi:hypothetical protein
MLYFMLNSSYFRCCSASRLQRFHIEASCRDAATIFPERVALEALVSKTLNVKVT